MEAKFGKQELDVGSDEGSVACSDHDLQLRVSLSFTGESGSSD